MNILYGFLNSCTVLSMYIFGLDSFKPWLVASGMDVSRSVNKQIFSYISVKISTLSHYFIEASI